MADKEFDHAVLARILDNEALRYRMAQDIYDTMRFGRHDKTPDWDKDITSDAQAEAMARAYKILDQIKRFAVEAEAKMRHQVPFDEGGEG